MFNVGDNMVGFMSQIGWTENEGDQPTKKIEMEEIFILVDTNGGNGNGILIAEMLNMLHSKINHRIDALEKVIEYLSE